MSSSDEVREALIDMGVDPAKSHAASTMFGSVDAAINWVFGEGENWQPPELAPPPPDYVTVPQPPPSPANDRPVFGSNNPFAQQMGQLPAPPPPPPRRPEDDSRHVRASAPPPSPRVEPADPLDGVPFFGPSNKDDPDGKLAVALPSAPVSNTNKEEEDFQRAIQESMMTASFHSAGSAAAEELPPVGEREDGQPLVYATLKHPQNAVQMVQALAAIPQLRQVLAAIDWTVDDPGGDLRKTEGSEVELLQQLFKLQDTEKVTYQVVDPALDLFRPAWTNPHTSTVYANLTGEWLPELLKMLGRLGRNREQLIDFGRDVVCDWQHGPDQLIATSLHINPDEPHPYVMFERGFDHPSNLHAALSALIWGNSPGGGGGQGVEALGDVQFVHLHRSPGFPAPQWELDETIALDRYLYHNRKWVTQVRAEQNLAEAELARLREKLESLSRYKGNNISDAIQALVKHLANSPSSDPVQTESRVELKAKLEKIAEKLNEKMSKLQEEIRETEKRTSGALFETTDPERLQHRYRLRAVMWHDGFLTPGKHLYTYVKEGDQWWKVEGVEATKVSWDDITSDSTGQFTDGGPYLLIYSREGLRPAPPPPSSPEAPKNVGVWGGMEGSGVHPANWDSSNLIDIDDDNGIHQTPLEPEHEDGLKDEMAAPGTTVTAVPVRSRRNTLDSEALSRETTREERREGEKRPSTVTYSPASPVSNSRRSTLDATMRSPQSRKSSVSSGIVSPPSRKATLSPNASRKSTLDVNNAVRSPSRKASATLDTTPSRKASTSQEQSGGVLSPSRKNTHDKLIKSPSRKSTHESLLSPSRKSTYDTVVTSPSRKSTKDSAVKSPSRQGTSSTDSSSKEKESKREVDGDIIMD